jgi:hypothetical protein
VWNLRTPHGKIDITFLPSGFPAGYNDLRARAQPLQAAQTTVIAAVASLHDVEHSKRTGGRAIGPGRAR